MIETARDDDRKVGGRGVGRGVIWLEPQATVARTSAHGANTRPTKPLACPIKSHLNMEIIMNRG